MIVGKNGGAGGWLEAVGWHIVPRARILPPAKSPRKGKIKTLPDKQRWKKFIASRPVLSTLQIKKKTTLKDILQAKKK